MSPIVSVCIPTAVNAYIYIYISFVLCLQYTDYHEVSKGYGGKGFLVSDDSCDLSSILKTAQSLCKEGHAVLINALIGSSKFREGSISV
jgi:acetolactate synthase-like protein